MSEINEMIITTEYNDKILKFLKTNQVDAELVNDIIAISRESMIARMQEDEDMSYLNTLKLIRDYMPDGVKVMWNHKDDDYYYLEILKNASK